MEELRAIVTIEDFGEDSTFCLRPLELAELVARRRGFEVVDCEPTDTGWKIVCTKWGYKRGVDPERQVTGRGTSLDQAAVNLVKAIY